MDLITLILASVILLIIVKIYPSLYEFYLNRKKLNKIPGPPQFPLFGHTFQLLSTSKEDLVWYFHRHALNFKDGFYRLYILHDGFVSLCSPKHLELLLPCNDNITKDRIYNFIKPWLGEGLLTSTGQRWFHDRKMLTPSFHFNILADFVPAICEKADILVNCLDKALKQNPGKPLNIFTYILKCALDVLCETALGVNLNVQSKTNVEYTNALHRFTQLSIYRLFSPWLISDFIFYKTPVGKEFKEKVEIMHQMTRDIIKTRKEERRKAKNKSVNATEADIDIGGKRRKAMLDLLLDASEMDTQPLTDEQIREQVDTFLFAGHDTTAAAITWALFCLGNDLECQEKVHEELEQVLGDSTGPLTIRQLAELKYLERVMKESLRLYPSVPIVTRKLDKEIIVDGYTIPKDSHAIISPFSTHRHPDFWDNPSKFDPDRFLPENSKNRSPYAYIPFSAGPRNCIGQKFAMMEEKIVLASVLKKWKVKSVLPHDQMKMDMSFILRPHSTVDLYFTEKNQI